MKLRVRVLQSLPVDPILGRGGGGASATARKESNRAGKGGGGGGGGGGGEAWADEEEGLEGGYRIVDEVRSYAAVRSVGRAAVENNGDTAANNPGGRHMRLTLNGRPLFHLGVLDQGE